MQANKYIRDKPTIASQDWVVLLSNHPSLCFFWCLLLLRVVVCWSFCMLFIYSQTCTSVTIEGFNEGVCFGPSVCSYAQEQ